MLLCAMLTMVPASALAQDSLPSDPENCLLCHRYPTIGRFMEDGTLRVYYVNDRMWLESVHGEVECSNCHEDVDRIPHTGAEPVDCSTTCHITEPSEDDYFSHGNMVEKYSQSVHGKLQPNGEEKPHAEDLPRCLDCHDNKVLAVSGGLWGTHSALSEETLVRCKGCHTDAQWIERMYAHMTMRFRRHRDPAEVVRTCTGCHEDSDKMQRHGVESVDTFKETYHWKLVQLGEKDAPDCISCHVPTGYNAHEIRPAGDPISPLNKVNRVETCSNPYGAQSCHTNASEKFATGRVHAYGDKAAIAAGVADAGDIDPLLLERARGSYDEGELSRYRFIVMLKYLYKLLIGAIVGTMVLYNTLELYRARKTAKEGDVPARPAKSEGSSKLFVRLNPRENGQHIALLLLFMLLAVTGFMAYATAGLSEQAAVRNIQLFIRSWTHRLAGIGLILLAVNHLYYVASTSAGRRLFVDMLPRLVDVSELAGTVLYYAGLRSQQPPSDRFNFRQKTVYYALWIGTTLLTLSGVALWTGQYLDKFVVDVALVVHSMEAVLACLILMVRHLWDVYVRREEIPLTWTLRVPPADEEQMKEEFALHYDKVMADPDLQSIYVWEPSEDEEDSDGEGAP